MAKRDSGSGAGEGERAHHDDDRIFLEKQLSHDEDDARAARSCASFLRGFDGASGIGPCVTVFGSARFKPGSRHYELPSTSVRLFREGRLHRDHRGGPGVMEAAKPGGEEGGGREPRLQHRAAREQRPNPYLDRFIDFRYFFVRK